MRNMVLYELISLDGVAEERGKGAWFVDADERLMDSLAHITRSRTLCCSASAPTKSGPRTGRAARRVQLRENEGSFSWSLVGDRIVHMRVVDEDACAVGRWFVGQVGHRCWSEPAPVAGAVSCVGEFGLHREASVVTGVSW
jgi:hypothetical protein